MGRPRVVQEVSLALLLKVAALGALYWLFFGPAHRPVIDNNRLATHLVAPQPSRDEAGAQP
jgi:hypothetical protein